MKKARAKRTNLINLILALVCVVLVLGILESLTRTVLGWLFLIALAALAASAVFLLKVYPAWRKSDAYRALQLADVDNMSGEQFERYVNELLKAQGYKTEMTPVRNDYGVDIVAEMGGVRYAIQCKRYGENISRGAVSDAVSGKHYYNCGQAMVVTNRYFRQGARELASASQCLLVDRDALAGWIQSFQAPPPASSITSAKARSIAIWVVMGSSACAVILIAVFLAFPARRTTAPQPAQNTVTKPTEERQKTPERRGRSRSSGEAER